MYYRILSKKIIQYLNPGLRLAHLALAYQEIDIGTTAQSVLAAADTSSLSLLATTASLQFATGYRSAFLFAVCALSHHLGNR